VARFDGGSSETGGHVTLDSLRHGLSAQRSEVVVAGGCRDTWKPCRKAWIPAASRISGCRRVEWTRRSCSSQVLDFRPGEGVTRFQDQRVVILSAAAMGLLRRERNDTFGTEMKGSFARSSSRFLSTITIIIGRQLTHVVYWRFRGFGASPRQADPQRTPPIRTMARWRWRDELERQKR
jgi:hypothetical protein